MANFALILPAVHGILHLSEREAAESCCTFTEQHEQKNPQFKGLPFVSTAVWLLLVP